MSWDTTSTWSVERYRSWIRTQLRSQNFLSGPGHRYGPAPVLRMDLWVFVCLFVCFDCSVFSLQAYKESVLEPMLLGSDKTPALINDYKEYHTDATVKFVVRMSEEKLAQAEAVGLHKVFKLQSSLTCNSMVPLPGSQLFVLK